MGQGALCYIPNFMEVRPLVPKKKTFKVFLAYMGVEAIWSCDQHYINIFFSSYLKAYIQNLVKKGQVVSEKNKFLF